MHTSTRDLAMAAFLFLLLLPAALARADEPTFVRGDIERIDGHVLRIGGTDVRFDDATDVVDDGKPVGPAARLRTTGSVSVRSTLA